MIFNNECRQNLIVTLVWSVVLGFILAVVIAMYPVLAKDMSSIVGMMNNLGPFAQALKIDGLQVNKLIGFYGMEMEHTLGLGGAFFAAYLGGKLLAREEGNHTAEFLLTHPISRLQVYIEKLLALLFIVFLFDLLVAGLAWFTILGTSQSVNLSEFFQLHLSSFFVHLSIAWLTYGISAFMKSESIGLSLGLVFVLFFINIFINLYSKIDFLKFLTPFQFSFPADILNKGIDWTLTGIILGWTGLVCLLGGLYFNQKDIHG